MIRNRINLILAFFLALLSSKKEKQKDQEMTQDEESIYDSSTVDTTEYDTNKF